MSDKPSLLVAGAVSGGYGEPLASRLTDDYDVYLAQEFVAKADGFKWLPYNPVDAPSTAALILELDSIGVSRERGIRLDAVIHAGGIRDNLTIDNLTQFDIARSFSNNVAQPLILTKYLLDYGVLAWTGSVITVTETPTNRDELLIAETSRKSLPVFMEALSEHFPATLFNYHIEAQRTRLGWLDDLVGKVKNCLKKPI